MALADYEVVKKTIPFNNKGGSFEIRGLNTDDFTFMIATNLDRIADALAKYQESGDTIWREGGLDDFVKSLIRELPELVAEVISTAADEPTLIDKARKLPFGVQMTALVEIMGMTLEEAGGVKNLFATLANLLLGALPNEARAVAEQMIANNGSLSSIGAVGATQTS